MKRLLLLLGAAAGLTAGAAELLPNGDFEQKFKDWHYPDYAGKPEPGAVVSNVVYGGNFGYRMGLEGDTNNDLYISFKPEAGRDHQISLMWKCEGVPEKDVEVRLLRNAGKQVVGWASNPAGSGVNVLASTGGTHGWKEVKIVINGSEFPAELTSANLYFKRKNNSVGNLWIDEVSVQPVAAAPAETASGASPALPPQWEYESWRNIPVPGSVDRAVSRSGAGSYCMFAPDQKGALIYRKIPYRSDEGVRIKFYLKCENVPEKDVTFQILANTTDKKTRWIAMPPGSGVNVLGSAGGSFDWKEFELTIPADAIGSDVASLLFYIRRADNGAGKVFVDEFRVEALKPEELKPVANLWPGDGSFEGDSCFFQLPPVEGVAFHGRRSVLLDAAANGFTSGYLFRVMRPNRSYTLSCYVRSDRPGRVRLNVNSQRYEQIGSGSVDAVPGEWKRLIVRLRPQSQVSSCQLQFSKPEGVEVCFDGFQLAEGTNPGIYTPGAALALGVDRSGEPGEILFTEDAPLTQTMRLHNNSEEPLTVEYSARLDGFGVPSREIASGTKEIAPGKTALEPLTLAPSREVGYYVLRLAAKANGQEYHFNYPFAVTQPPVKTENPFFGLHPMGPTSVEILRRIGVGATRHMPGWRYIPEKDGVYRFSQYDVRYGAAGMKQMNSVKVALVPPKYRREGEAFTDMTNVSEFLKQAIAAWGNVIDDWEIENEPDLVFPGLFSGDLQRAAECYADCVNAVAPLFRGRFRLHGSGVSGVDFNTGFPFTRTVLKRAGHNIDVVPVHPYANARYIDAGHSDIGPEANAVYRKTRDLQQLIRENGGNQPVWYGEIGWALDVEEDFLSEPALRHAAYLSRLMLIGKAAGVERVMYFLADFCIEKERFYYGLWRNTLPLPAALAYAASAQWLEGAAPGETISDSDIQCFTYRGRDGRPFAALWTADGVEATAEIPLRAEALEAADFFNRPMSLEAGDGKTRVKISGYPVYLRLLDGDAARLAEAMRKTKFDLPPVGVGWRLSSGTSVELTLSNLRTAPLSGQLTLSGAEFNAPERELTLEPGESTIERFDATGSLNGRTLTLKVESDLGMVAENYRAELLSCPAGSAAEFMGRTLPSIGRLPVMDSRDYLIPNDPENGYDGPEDLSIESAAGYDADNLYLAIDVRDDVHSQPYGPGRLWAGDSIQLALDTRADALPNVFGFARDDYELTFGLTGDGPERQFDYIYERGRSAESLAEIRSDIFRSGDRTCYRIAIPWRVLKLTPEPGMVFGMNFIANDHDGHGRNYWMGLTPGIGEGKNPYAYRKFILE